MNRIQAPSAFICLCIFFLTQSCSKKDPGPSREQLLTTSNGWSLTAQTVTPAYQGMTDLFPTINDCIKDNVLKFQSTGYYNLDEGDAKCQASDPQTIESGTWSFDSSKTILTLLASISSSTSALGTVKIATLTKTQFAIKQTTIVSGVTYTIITTYTAL